MSELVKSNQDIVTEDANKEEICVGDIFVSNARNSSKYVRRIRKIKTHKNGKETYYNYEYDFMPDILTGIWEIAEHEVTQKDKSKTLEPATVSKSELKDYFNKISGIELQKWISQAKEFLETGELKGYEVDELNLNNDAAIVAVGSGAYLATVQSGLEQKKGALEGMQDIIRLHMEQEQNKLEVFRRKLEGTIKVFKKQIEKVQRVITVIELFLGIEEELHQLRDGIPANVNEPITFRQQVLYMDEETKILTDGGLDWKRIEEFDDWLMKDDNFKKMIPEQKCVVCFKPRRYSKEYTQDGFINAMMNKNNKLDTYFLIRNGEKVYRIFTDKITVWERLFPQRDELNKMFEEMNKKLSDSSEWQHEEIKEKAEMQLFLYKKIAFFYEGLLNRTEVFHPLPMKLSIMNMGDFPDCFNFVYDDDANTLPTGRIPFWEWHEELNAKIVRGTRVLIAVRQDNRNADRLFYWCKEHNAPPSPERGVYEIDTCYEETNDDLPHYLIEELEAQGLLISKEPMRLERFCKGYEEDTGYHEHPAKKGQEVRFFKGEKHSQLYVEAYSCKFKKLAYYITYLPKDTVYGSWGDYDPHERKKSVRWRVYPDSDKFIFNYDLIENETIDFYIHSRADRHNYYQMLPVLLEMAKQRKEEAKWEIGFAKMLLDNATRKYGEKLDVKKCTQFITDCIAWWKTKVIFKRPITKDDTKALRMIESRVLAEANKKLITKNGNAG